MQLNWSTFILEIINFLVLVWILKHLFYAPIQKAILKRKDTIQESLDKVKKLHDESNQLKEKYENRLQDWKKKKNKK